MTQQIGRAAKPARTRIKATPRGGDAPF